jgi:hypothetical protein
MHVGEMRTPIKRTDFAELTPLAMTFFRTRLSAAIAWAMIPLAAWAGMPSTGCVCANGHLKLFCQHLLREMHAAGGHNTACGSDCCEAVADQDHDADCCGGGFCCHGPQSAKPGIGSKSCCNPILTAPSVAPQTVTVPCDQVPAVVTVALEIGAIVHPSFAFDAADVDTGPPLDRVIVFRSLLI